jgi:hypothetical protein
LSTANFFFHGLFPDHIEANECVGKQVSKILFDVDFEGKFYSHYLADLWLLEEEEWDEDGVPIYEVRYELPFKCDDFSKAVVQYYQQVVGPQSTSISHSGPKGFNPKNNVFRVQWQISLEASKK